MEYDHLQEKNRKALIAWQTRCRLVRYGLVKYSPTYPRFHMMVLDREWMEKRLAARRWLMAHSEDFTRYTRDNIIDFMAFNRRRNGR